MSSGDLSSSMPSPSLQNILDQKSLRWIFVGGKGGVGKTTCSCSLATQLSHVRDSVLLISTDPAHNVSDAFDQKFTRSPTLVNGYTNLYAMEIDPTCANLNANDDDDADDLVDVDDLPSSSSSSKDGNNAATGGISLPPSIRNHIKSLTNSLPGVDEFMAYTEVLRLVRSLNFSVVVFDTAPTGHTLRLLAFPATMEQSMGKIINIKNKFGPLLNQFGSFLGFGNMNSDDISRALEDRLPFMRQVTEQFKNPEQTTFICVCIPEFLSVYETERLIQELANQEIDVHNIIVNQLLLPAQKDDPPCNMCNSRRRQQAKYMEQIEELYDDFHITRLPALHQEVRGVNEVKEFSKHLITPCEPLLHLVELSKK